MAQTLFDGKTFTVLDNSGAVVVGAEVTVLNAIDPDPADVLNTLAVIFANRDGTGTIDQGVSPMATDAAGQVTFYADAGFYHIKSDDGVIVRYLADVPVGTAKAVDQEELGGGGGGGSVGDYVLSAGALPANRISAGDIFTDTDWPEAALIFPVVPSTPLSYSLSEGSIPITLPDITNNRVFGDIQRVVHYRGKVYWCDGALKFSSYVESTNTYARELVPATNFRPICTAVDDSDSILVLITAYSTTGQMRYSTRTADGGFVSGAIPDPGAGILKPSIVFDGTQFCLFTNTATDLYVTKSTDGITWGAQTLVSSVEGNQLAGVVGSKLVWINSTSDTIATTDIGDFDVAVNGVLAYTGAFLLVISSSVDPFGVGFLAWDSTNDEFILSTDGISFTPFSKPASFASGEPRYIQWLAPHTWGASSTTGAMYYSVDDGATWVSFGVATNTTNSHLIAPSLSGGVLVSDSNSDMNEFSGSYAPGVEHKTFPALSPSIDLEYQVIMSSQ